MRCVCFLHLCPDSANMAWYGAVWGDTEPGRYYMKSKAQYSSILFIARRFPLVKQIFLVFIIKLCYCNSIKRMEDSL